MESSSEIQKRKYERKKEPKLKINRNNHKTF